MSETPEIMQFFNNSHQSPALSVVSRGFADMAEIILDNLPDCEERSVALRKLLEAKDAAVRAKTVELMALKNEAHVKLV